MTTEARTREFFDALLATYDTMTKAAETAGTRGLKLSQQYLSDLATRQRAAIELAKKVAAEPGNLGLAYSSVMEATAAAQGQALEFAQLAYKESLAAGSEARESVDALLAASKGAAEAAVALSKDWMATNPFADFVQGSMNMFSGSTGGSKAKSPA